MESTSYIDEQTKETYPQKSKEVCNLILNGYRAMVDNIR